MKKKKEIRTETVIFRVAKAEKKIIKAAAKARGFKKVSDYMRMVLLG